MLGEAFTIMAVLEATDKMSRVLEKIDGGLNKFTEHTVKAAEVATEAGAKIDEALLKTASGADAVELSDARLATARERLARATEAQSKAETALLNARATAASEEEMAVAAQHVAESQQAAAESAKALKEAQAGLAAATKAKASEEDLAAATEKVTAAEARATKATVDLTAARERQAALVTPEDIAKAADTLTAAERRAAKATRDNTAAETRQAEVQRASAAASSESAAATDEAAAAQTRVAQTSEAAAAGAGAASKAMKYGALALAAISYESIKAAGNFESLTQHLVTDGGESQKNLAMIRAGMLSLSTQTGTSTTEMAAGMLHVESAGYHGAEALKVLQTSAEGAKVGSASLDTVSKALTGTMNAYGVSASGANSMMNQLIAAVAQGDMKMQDLASSLGNVAPAAAAAHISLSQVLAAVATMTAQNMSAQQATQDLNHTIGQMEKPSNLAVQQMQAIGVSANDVSANLGKRGLTGTLDLLVTALAAHTKGGEVFISSLKSSEIAAQNAQIALKALPPSIQSAAAAWQAGSLSTKDFNKELSALPPAQQNLGHQFELLVKHSGSFNDLLRSGKPAAQTFNAALATMMGGSTGLNTALMLTGTHMAAFKSGANAIADAAKKSGAHVEDWDKIQSTFNQKLDRAKASVEAAGIAIGTALLPVVSKIAGVIAGILGPMASWISQHQGLVKVVLALAGAAGLGMLAVKIVEIVKAMREWAIVQLILNGEMEANPIGLIVTAIALLVMGVIYAYTHFKTFREVVNAVFSAVKTVIVGAWHVIEATWKALVAAAEWVGHAFAAAFNAVASVVETVWGVIKGVWDTVVSVTEDVWNGISGFFAKWWPLLLVIFAAPIAVLMGIWNHFHSAITSAIHAVWGAISAFFQATWDAIKFAAQAVWAQIQLFIVTPMKLAWSILSTVMHTIWSVLASVWNAIFGVAKSIWAGIKMAIVQPLVDAWNWLTGWIGKFLDIGTNIVMGIIHGVENAASWLFDSLKNLANSALNAAKSALGINSPSKLFADHVGRGISEGIALGVDQHAHLAHKAVRRLSSGLAVAAQGTLNGSFTATVGGGRIPVGGAGGAVYLNIDLRQSRISSERDARQLATTLGNTVVRQLAHAGIRTPTF